jgi:hypothetical protein
MALSSPHLEEKYQAEKQVDPYSHLEGAENRKKEKGILRRKAFMTALETKPYKTEEAQQICKTPCPRFQGKPKCLCEVYHLPQYQEMKKSYLIWLYSKQLDDNTLTYLKRVPHDPEDEPEDESATQGKRRRVDRRERRRNESR